MTGHKTYTHTHVAPCSQLVFIARLLIAGNGDGGCGCGCAASIARNGGRRQFVCFVLLIYAPLKMRYYRAHFADTIRAHSILLWEQLYTKSSSDWPVFVINLKYSAVSSFINMLERDIKHDNRL